MSDLATRLTRIGVAAAVASAITDLVFTLAISLPRSERLVAIVMATIWLTLASFVTPLSRSAYWPGLAIWL